MAAQSTWTPIATLTLATSGGLAFNNVPQNYTDLVLVCSVRSTYNAASDVGILDFGYTTNHSYTALRAVGTTPTSYNGTASYGLYCNAIPAATTNANIFGTFVAHIFNYSNSTTYKTAIVRQGWDLNGSGGTTITVGMKNLTAPLTTVELGGGNAALAAGSTATLYGITAA